ncbi:UPF0575 protein C19orf67 homolog [Plectropomus leopardus]|uniref:UPF0575 protein C19orf67 homolog n=1 Tax=Plectropomus leopardus TaxID=160734 RepID=UPI001C4ADDD9|nr:UPF0575 protein C19orf67 homolog [Plectropomus leopardus]
MTDMKVQVEGQLNSNSPSGQQEDTSDERETDITESLQNTGQGEAVEPLSLLAAVALAPPRDHPAACRCDCEACSCLEVKSMERSLQSMDLQLQFLLSKADDLHDCVVKGQRHGEGDALAAAVQSFLYTCQPFFNHLETTRALSQHPSVPFDVYTRRMQLLDFSQQLCDRLEQLVLTCASCSVFSLDETNPNSMSHFCIGQSQLGQLRVTTFRFCKATPYLARVDTGLYKRMRWNVERLGHERQTDEESEAETVGSTDHYFLCYEDIPNPHADAVGDSQGATHGSVVRMWSIGQWVQVNPDTDDICDWILCEVPRADYHRLLYLGSDEPSSCNASDYLQQLLLSHHTTA